MPAINIFTEVKQKTSTNKVKISIKRKYQKEIMELRNTKIELKNSLECFNSRLN